MKTVVMIRHAKAESGGFENDEKRKLSPKGRLDAAQISSQLRVLNFTPGRMLASTADRAWETAEIYAQHTGFNNAAIEPWEAFYHGVSTFELLEQLQQTPEKADCVFIVGHNPTMHYLSHNLCVEFNQNTPTCATAVIHFNVDNWQDIDARMGSLFLHLTP